MGTQITAYQYDDSGRLVMMAEPSAVSGYDATKQNPLGGPDNMGGVVGGTLPTNYTGLRDNTGLIDLYSYAEVDGSSDPRDINLCQVSIEHGQKGTAILQETRDYYQYAFGDVTIDPLATDTVYGSTGGGDARQTKYAYSFGSGTHLTSMSVTQPSVSGGSVAGSGSGIAVTTYDGAGNISSHTDADGNLTNYYYDSNTGGLLSQIVDPAGLDEVTEYAVDGLGRPTSITDPLGLVTTIGYDDANHSVTTNNPDGTEQVVETNYEDDETQTQSFDSEGNLSGLTTTDFDLGGRTIESDNYFAVNTVSLGPKGDFQGGFPWSFSDTDLSCYYATLTRYDNNGNPDINVDANGTITMTQYDGENRPVNAWVGVDSSFPYTDPAQAPNASDMRLTTAYQYNDVQGSGTDGGDGTLAAVIQYPTSTDTQGAGRTMSYYYNFMDQQVASIAPNDVISFNVLDNLGEVTTADEFNGASQDGSTPVTSLVSSGGSWSLPSSSLLRAQMLTSFNDDGEAYSTTRESVNQSSGAVTTGVNDTSYFDQDGNVVAEDDAGDWTKFTFDKAGDQTGVYNLASHGGSAFSLTGGSGGDLVSQQTQMGFNADGDPTVTISSSRTSGSSTGAIMASQANVDYSADYYNSLGQMDGSVDFGTDGSSSLSLAMPTFNVENAKGSGVFD